MKVLFAASEGVPFVKTGGLADVIGSLPRHLKSQGFDVRVILPKYSDIPICFREQMLKLTDFMVPLGWRNLYCGIEKLKYDGIIFYFIDNEFYFKRQGLYGFEDDAERFAFFDRAILEVLPRIDFQPNIIHCHDWHTGMISTFLKSHYRNNPFYQDIRTVFTIHNLQYQGVFPRTILQNVLGLGNEYFGLDGLEFYGQVSFMKGGVNYSDILTTVSETYAEEIQLPQYGEQLDGLLRHQKRKLHGILNGIDIDIYNPDTDPHICVNFSRETVDKKHINKESLQKILCLPMRPDVPVFGMVSRLVSQKGLELIGSVLDDILALDVQLVVLGSGEKHYEDMFRSASRRYPDKVSVNIMFGNTLAHRIYAGSDIYLMPSAFEPCGLSQMIALRYGSIPIVRETGGLRDTIQPYNEYTGEGNGFSFTHFNAQDFLYTLKRTISFYRQRNIWSIIVSNAMQCDFSWYKSAQKYQDLYKKLLFNGDR
ncbi:glycogen synthase (ADP-glucose) [Desulforamulus reducens MI-1]|uniref:Glycogen synthase n=1 Tax=Desulforamulus reducens (strain ATCC BAA-1160 / DSM 100696 / MI-1) TaxID=349161 RepID=GLGA_DESRM|nr:glycogen synthase GlgA [Desulforamulus reducens]A4J4I4.1 RecName: Full=Glycogen synthase; AltName: Full=Starch [bacterial glycogen] synthase [Desulforamulus reducens MI-1]ABO49987.1 glycogen synthase (ADP-glucose) [Desulforamulus reducens MI-1]